MIDIGSTFTKACSIDLSEEKILATVCTPSTTNTNVSEGIEKAIQLLNTVVQRKIDYKIRFASSSAAGGLRIVVVGLVPELTVKAGKLSAYNAGAKIVGTYSYKLNKYEIIEIEKLNPEVSLVYYGTRILKGTGDEQTAVRFRLDSAGEVVGTNELQKRLLTMVLDKS